MAQKSASQDAVTIVEDTTIRPFKVDIPQEAVDELRRRLAATRWPTKELVGDASQGVQEDVLRVLARYWATEHDWRRTEAKLNALPQFKTTIDGLDIHFIHVRSKHEGAMPLLITHGWPGSVIEMLEVIGPLTDPTAHGGKAQDAFDVVVPSVPGFGFSDEPTVPGWDPGRVAGAWAQLMHRLGYERYVAQGGDMGATVTDAMARQAPEGLVGIHLNLLTAFPQDVGAAIFGGLIPAGLIKRVGIAVLTNRAAKKDPETLKDVAALFRRGYFVEMPEHPQTIGYALTDTPVGMGAWMLDHDADSYAKIARTFLEERPSGGLTRDRIVDNLAMYWLTNTATSSARIYWENYRTILAGIQSGQKTPDLNLPVAFTVFPGEIFQAPRKWAEKVYPNLIYFNEVDRGGHFAAWEEPELFATELRDAFRQLR